MTANDICIPNIDEKQRRLRLNFGFVTLLIGLAILAAMLYFGVGRWWRMVLIIFWYGAALGFFQARDKT